MKHLHFVESLAPIAFFRQLVWNHLPTTELPKCHQGNLFLCGNCCASFASDLRVPLLMLLSLCMLPIEDTTRILKTFGVVY